MITLEQAEKYASNIFKEENVKDRITDKGFAFFISGQPREYIESNDSTKSEPGTGGVLIIKTTGEVYGFSSSPIYMFGDNNLGIGVNTAKSLDEFTMALNELIATNDNHAKPIFVIE
jgi:hypothetical protein